MGGPAYADGRRCVRRAKKERGARCVVAAVRRPAPTATASKGRGLEAKHLLEIDASRSLHTPATPARLQLATTSNCLAPTRRSEIRRSGLYRTPLFALLTARDFDLLHDHS